MSDEHGNPRPEPGIGRGLRRAREDKGLTLGQVEQATKIRTRYIQAFEREDFDVLPAVYVLGSLKTYADFLGLDGAALAGRLKASLGTAEPDIAAQLASLEGSRGEVDEYEAAPVAAVGFDRLFLGMGMLLISILAVMTLVTSLAQGDESPISQLDEPSTLETPSEIALAANVVNPQLQPTDGPTPAKDDGNGRPEARKAGDGEDGEKDPSEDKPEASKDGEDDKNQDDPRGGSLFGDAKFVSMTLPSPTAKASSSGSSPASASASATASASAQPNEPFASASAAASSSGPYEGGPEAAPAPPAAAAESQAVAPSGPGSAAGTPTPVGAVDQGRTSADVDRSVNQVFERVGLDP